MRELTRTITRRIGDVVITLTEDGILVRKFRRRSKQTAKLVTYAELLHFAGADPARSRNEAFEKPSPKGWVPQGGDRVYLDHTKTGRAAGIVLSTIQSVPELCFLIRLPGGKTQVFALSDLRPAPAVHNHDSQQNELALEC